MAAEGAAPAWIGPRPRGTEIFALIFCGVTGIMVAGLEPVLLGALAQERRVSAGQIGEVATVELLTMGLAAGLSGIFLKSAHLKWTAIIALIALAGADVATQFASGAGLILARAAAGAPSGVLVWLTISLIARAPTPERWAGAYLTVQTMGQCVMAGLLSTFIVPHAGANGAFLALAGLCTINVAAAFLAPRDLAPLPEAASAGLPNARGWAALGVSFLFLAVSSGVWVYLEQLAAQAHLPADAAGWAVLLSLASQVAGGLTATVIAGRVRWFALLVACGAVDLCVFAGFAAMPGAGIFLALACVLGFVWLFATPFLVPLTIDADPTRRAALLIGGAQLTGGSLGPLFASFFVTNADARGALAFASVCLAAALTIVVALYVTRAKAPVA